MIYKVKAKLIESRAAEFYEKLTDGSIEGQEEDGAEIYESMKRATIDAFGTVRWSETCFCPIPLYHETDTVFDRYFTELETELVDDYQTFEGESFLAYLARLVNGYRSEEAVRE